MRLVPHVNSRVRSEQLQSLSSVLVRKIAIDGVFIKIRRRSINIFAKSGTER